MHVEDLVAEHMLSVDYVPDADPRADPGTRHVVIPPVVDRTTYFIALSQIAIVIGERPQ